MSDRHKSGTDKPDTGKPTVSLLMIVRNEEQQLAACLAPAAALFDEIVIVDTGSRDQTKRVAAQFTPHVFDFPWCDDFSAARNESLRRSHGDWLFWLDADDRLTPENATRLAALLQRLGDAPQAFLMNTVCASRYECEGVSLITHPRLFRRHPELHWQGRVHEQLRPEVAQLGFDVQWSDVQIHHVGYQDPSLQQRKLQRDVRLLRMDYAVDPDDVSTLVHLGLAYFHLGRYDQARQFLGRLLQGSRTPAEHLRQVYGALAAMAMREGNLPQALATLDQALRVFPDGEHLLYLRADCLYELDRYSEAENTLARIIAGPGQQQYRGGVPGEIKTKLAPRKLADVLRLKRDFAAAEQLLLSLVQRFPDDSITWHTLGRVYLDSRQRVKLLSVVERLKDCPQGEVFGLLLRATWHLAHHEVDVAGELIERLIVLVPQMPLPRILRTEWLTQCGAPLADRIQACRDILRVQPGHIDAQRLLQSLEVAARQVALPAARGFSTSVVLGAGFPGCVEVS